MLRENNMEMNIILETYPRYKKHNRNSIKMEWMNKDNVIAVISEEEFFVSVVNSDITSTSNESSSVLVEMITSGIGYSYEFIKSDQHDEMKRAARIISVMYNCENRRFYFIPREMLEEHFDEIIIGQE